MAAMIVGMVVLVGKRRGVGYIDEAFRLPSIHSMRIEGPGGRKTNQATTRSRQQWIFGTSASAGKQLAK